VPELPDVETFRHYLDATSLHQEIQVVDVHASRMLDGVSRQGLRAGLEGGEFLSTTRYGKFLFMHLTAGPWLSPTATT
jgi:formamidopyrimidine-DNA glycosylase